MTVQRFTAELQALDEFYISSFPESTIRGGIGYAFKEALCLTNKKKCEDCIIATNCPYYYLFETTLPESSAIMRKYDRIPHPFVISFRPPKLIKDNDKLFLDITLIGKSLEYLPYFVLGLNRLGELGLGRDRGKFVLSRIAVNNGGKTVYSKESNQIDTNFPVITPFCQNASLNSDCVTLDFISPARIKYNGKYNHDMRFSIIIRNLLRRITNLAYFHCRIDTKEFDFNRIIKLSNNIIISKNELKWSENERYSTRQKQHMRLGGYIGEIKYKGEINPFIRFLKAGELLHIGKTTSFGMGKYNIISRME